MGWKLCKRHTFWMAPRVICCFIVILLYTGRKRLLKRNLATVLPLKFKLLGKFNRFNAIDVSKCQKNSWISKNFNQNENFKTFWESQTASCLKEIIQPPPDKNFLCLWNKNSPTEIYRNMQTSAFQLLRECSSWACRNGAVQMFFSDTNQKHVFGCIADVHNVEWVKVWKMTEAFCVKLYYKNERSFLLVFICLEISTRKSEINR